MYGRRNPHIHNLETQTKSTFALESGQDVMDPNAVPGK